MITAHPNRTHAMTRSLIADALSFVAVPWNAFVGAFLYYAVLTVVAVGVPELSDRFMAVAYLAPVAAYVGLLATRCVFAMGAPARVLVAPKV
jgi:hypothetical protein